MYILPDKILVLAKRKVGAIDLADLNTVGGTIRFVEDAVPKDAKVVDYTWQFVNNNGSPDKRYKNNRQRSICLYGTLSFKTEQGFNVLIFCSNYSKADEFSQALRGHSF